MSVLIKGIEMPKNCKHCKFRKTELQEDPDWCLISGESLFHLAENDCPLVEVPDDVQPVKHGRWINTMPIVEYKSFCQVKCSICGSIEAYGNFCRNCGADMRGE